jgi:hypothetical protein
VVVYLCVRGFIEVSVVTGTSIKPLTHKYMTAHVPGLLQHFYKTPYTQIHDRSRSWLVTDTSIKPLTHKYTTTHVPGLLQALL